MYERPDAEPRGARGRAREHAPRRSMPAAARGAGAGARPRRRPSSPAMRRHSRRWTTPSSPHWPAPPCPGRAAAGAALERVPLPWFIKKLFMDAFLRDVHHYLFDVEFGPPGRPRVRIQQIDPQALRRRAGGAGRQPPARRGLAQHGHRDRLRLPEARRRLRAGRRAHHHRQPARPRRGSGQAAARLEPPRTASRTSGSQGRWFNFSTGSIRSAASTPSWRTTSATAVRTCHRPGGAERRGLAALGHQVSAPAGVRAGAAAAALSLNECRPPPAPLRLCRRA